MQTVDLCSQIEQAREIWSRYPIWDRKEQTDNLKIVFLTFSGSSSALKNLARTFRLKLRMALAEVKKLDIKRRNVAGHLSTFVCRCLSFNFCMAEDVENDLSEICRPLATSLASLSTARFQGICLAVNNSMTSFQKIIAALGIELSIVSPNAASSNNGGL